MQERPPPGGSAHHDPPTAPGALHQGEGLHSQVHLKSQGHQHQVHESDVRQGTWLGEEGQEPIPKLHIMCLHFDNPIELKSKKKTIPYLCGST